MAEVDLFKLIESGSVAAGNTVEKSWTSDDDYTIKYMIIQEKSASSLNKVPATIRIAGEPKTKDKVNLKMFQAGREQIPMLQWDLPDNKDFYISLTNNLSSSIDLYIQLALKKK